MPPAFVPQPLLQPWDAARVVSLYPNASDAAAASLNLTKMHEPEDLNLGEYSDGDRITTITNVHSPSFDMYPARGTTTGTCVILVPVSAYAHAHLDFQGCG